MRKITPLNLFQLNPYHIRWSKFVWLNESSTKRYNHWGTRRGHHHRNVPCAWWGRSTRYYTSADTCARVGNVLSNWSRVPLTDGVYQSYIRNTNITDFQKRHKKIEKPFIIEEIYEEEFEQYFSENTVEDKEKFLVDQTLGRLEGDHFTQEKRKPNMYNAVNHMKHDEPYFLVPRGKTKFPGKTFSSRTY